jgi:AcrR family transcriptional regulator
MATRPAASDSSERKDRILRAAEKLFRHYGPQKTSIADIAKAASCAVGSVYLEFPSKESILAALAAERQHVVAQAMVAAGEKGTPAVRFVAMLEARTTTLFRLAAEGAHAGDLVRCASEEDGSCEWGAGRAPDSDESDAKRTLREAPFFGWGFGAPVREVLVELLRAGAASGAFEANAPPENFVAVVERAFATLSPPWIFRQSEEDALRATKALARLVLHGLATRPSNRRASLHVRVRASRSGS